MTTDAISPEPLAPAAIAALLEASATTIEAEMTALADAATWHPAAGEWCANEVLGHILEAERRGFNGRVRTILADPSAAFEGWDQRGVAAARRDCERSSAEIVAEFLDLRRDSLALVRSLAPSDLDRAGVHAVVGRLTIGDVIAEWVHHDRNHARQILANTQARVWPQMGNARRFSQPDA